MFKLLTRGFWIGIFSSKFFDEEILTNINFNVDNYGILENDTLKTATFLHPRNKNSEFLDSAIRKERIV